MTKVYLSVTSHNNDLLIEKNFFHISGLYGNFNVQVSIIDNAHSSELRKKCHNQNVQYFSDLETRGYGGNNNKNFEQLKVKDNDIFIVCNPDVSIQKDQLEQILIDFKERGSDIYGVKVFEAEDLSHYSSHNRNFPALLDPIISLIFKKKLFENNADKLASPDWIGGAFMIFKGSSFKKLNGFDENYFMYYEDTDICHRAKSKFNMKIIYNPEFYIIHEAQREGRKIFSKNFMWNLSSMIKYFRRFPPKKLITI